MLCTKCGNKHASGAVCKKCGSPLLSRLSDDQPQKANETPQLNTSTLQPQNSTLPANSVAVANPSPQQVVLETVTPATVTPSVNTPSNAANLVSQGAKKKTNAEEIELLEDESLTDVTVPVDFKFSDEMDMELEDENIIASVPVKRSETRVHVTKRKNVKRIKRKVARIIVRILIAFFIALVVYFIIQKVITPEFFIFGF